MKTRKIALSITFAGSDITGLWTMNLDGSDLNRIIAPSLIDNYLQAINAPSWSTDGHWIVFGESLRGGNRSRIAKCDAQGKNIVYLTNGPLDYQPSVSPDSKKIVYVHDPMIKLKSDNFGDHRVAATLWIMNIDGTKNYEIPNPAAKLNWSAKGITGTYPAWSPDGKQIYAVSAGIVDVETGKPIAYGTPKVQNWPKLNGQPANIVMPHWGKCGFLCSGWGGGIQLSDKAMDKMLILASSDNKSERW